MAIDFIKVEVRGVDVEKLKQKDELDFKGSYSESTGEYISNPLISKYHTCEIKISEINTNHRVQEYYVEFSGSIHKMWNSINKIYSPKSNRKEKGFNGNQFFISQILSIKNHLLKLFECHSSQLIFHNVEIGLNLNTKFDPQLFIIGLLYHRGKLFEFSRNRRYAQVIHENFIIKVYNKSEQYGLDRFVLRFEIKVKKMRELQNFKIISFKDLNYSSLFFIEKFLLKKLNEIVYYDNSISKEGLSVKQCLELNKFSNPNFWIDNRNAKTRYTSREKLNKLISENSTNLKQQIEDDIKLKCFLYFRVRDHLQFRLNHQNHFNENRLNHSFIDLTLFGLNHNSSIEVFYNHLHNANYFIINRICTFTGVDISMQEKGSLILDETGLKFYYLNYPILYVSVRNYYLKEELPVTDMEIQFYIIIKKINTQKRKVISGIKKLLKKDKESLFPIKRTLDKRYMRLLDAL
jgi:hypothetical protein